MDKKAINDDRIRNWSFILYPESAPENWRDIIDELHIQWLESPIHDRDTDANGELKKPHIHILLLFDGKKSFTQIKEITENLNSPIPQKVASARGLVRYFLHLDNPEKAQYEAADIISHGGADSAEYLKPTSSTRYMLIKEMMDFVDENNIVEMRDLLSYARAQRFEDWFPLLCDNSAYIMNSLIKSNRGAIVARQGRPQDGGGDLR